jgi:NADPH:quinone reductase-like Zn-dependent oxidoreductase
LRALTISAHGGTDKLEFRTDVAEPDVTPGSVRVRIKAAALNQLDIFMLRGLPGVKIDAPWVMGADGVGVIDRVGAGVSNVAVGDTVIINPGISDRTCEFCLAGEQSECVNFRLLGEHLPGTLAEYVVVPAPNVGIIPADTPIEIAAAYPLATLTAWRMVHTRAKVTADDEVLIWGIGGGVAQAALRICKQIGAKVWVTSGSDEKLEKARELGADEVLNHRTMNVGKEIRARTGKRGVSVVLDSVGQATWNGSLAALGRAGRLVTCGGTSGPIVETDVRRLFWNQWTIMGSTMGNGSEFDAVVREFNEGRLKPVVDSVHELENGRAAFDRMAAGEQFGKIVVRVSE